MKTTIYKIHGNIFIPTNKTVKVAYSQGNVGDQLWQQMHNGLLTGNLFTELEMSSYGEMIEVSIEPNELTYWDGDENDRL